MNRRRFFVLMTSIAISFLIVVGCNQLASNNPANRAAQSKNMQSKSVVLTVSSAVSMQDAMKE